MRQLSHAVAHCACRRRGAEVPERASEAKERSWQGNAIFWNTAMDGKLIYRRPPHSTGLGIYAYMVTPLHQVRAQVRAHKASSTCYQHSVPLDSWLRLDDSLVPLLHFYLLHRRQQHVTAEITKGRAMESQLSKKSPVPANKSLQGVRQVLQRRFTSRQSTLQLPKNPKHEAATAIATYMPAVSIRLCHVYDRLCSLSEPNASN